ncbi:MAG: HEAT repeat domain-containing protein [Candidatus Eremiobacteraeota bacterium]|nr:HEAT repeat domain-containing protein [Candidatus Eremiobacteraeota bacterium]
MRDETYEHQVFALPGARPQYGPDKVVAVEEIDLHCTPHMDAESLDGICTLTLRALDEPVSRLALDAVDLEVLEVSAVANSHARPLAHAVRRGKLEVEFTPPIAPNAAERVRVRYRASKPRHGLFFVKPSAARPQTPAHVWTQSQDQYARYWFPCLDYPHEKQRTTTTIVVPKGTFALGNGELVERRDEDQHTVFRYRQEIPHSTYLMTLVAGPFVEVASGKAGKNAVPIYYYVLPGREADGERAFGNTSKMLDVFEERTGTPYPYPRYSQIAVSDFIFGGMENTAATTQTDRTLHDETAHLDFSSDPLVAHELAHQWFGNLLTCRDWEHAWLNEGFATFMEAVWREADLGRDEYLYDIFECLTFFLKEESERYRRPIVCNMFRDPIEIFDRHLYQKGAAVLHMLRGELGEARFWRALQRYVRTNAGKNVETIDLIRAIEEATGRNLRGFFAQWVYREGHPRLEVRVVWDPRRRVATVTVDQKQAIDAEHPAYEFDVEIELCGNGQQRRVSAHIEREHETVAVALDFEPALVRFDPGAFVLADVTYEFGAELSAAALSGDENVVGRIRAARELAKDGGRIARDALAEAFVRDEFWGVLAEAAAAAGATRAPWARELLISALEHRHPKVARAVATSLGNFRDAGVATALIGVASEARSYFVRAAALVSLGKTRDPRAFEILAAAAKARTWNGTVEGGAVLGLGELGDPRALPVVVEACRSGHDAGLRRAAIGALARLAELCEDERTRAVEELTMLLDDPNVLIAVEAIAAAEKLGDQRFLPALDRIGTQAPDGRARRDAVEAAIRIRKNAKIPAQVLGLRDDLNELREEQRKLQEKIEALARS